VSELEFMLVAKLLSEPSLAQEALAEVHPAEFFDSDLGLIAEVIAQLEDDGHQVTVPALVDELQRRSPRSNGHGWAVKVGELVDEVVFDLKVADTARRIHRAALEREARSLHARLSESDDAQCLLRLRQVQEELERGGNARPRSVSLADVAFTGEALLDLLQRPKPDPVEAARPVPGHFSLQVAPPFVGKTTLALWNAMARAAGASPWPGAEARPAGRVLIFSLDEAPEQVARRMSGLDIFHPAGRLEKYASNLVVIGPDRDVDTSKLDSLRFDERGLETLVRWLQEAQSEGRAFVEVYIDAYADVIPVGETENSNEEATRIGGALERLAVRFGCAIVLLHHAGKPKADAGEELPDLRFLGRGASALAAKARAVTSLELVGGMPHLRRVRTATNLGPTPKPAMFQVCAENADAEELLYFKPAIVTVRDPRDFLKPGECISTNDLARRLAGDSLPDGAEPPGEMKKLAASLRESWRERRLVTVRPGKRKSWKMIQLAEEETK
jgi:hypothetical protein